jgi:hypothetical protein
VITTPTPTPPTTSPDKGPDPVAAKSASRGHIGWVVASSLAVGLLTALLLAAAPFISPEENDVTGAVLCGFALGWTALTLLSMRFTNQPQR